MIAASGGLQSPLLATQVMFTTLFAILFPEAAGDRAAAAHLADRRAHRPARGRTGPCVPRSAGAHLVHGHQRGHRLHHRVPEPARRDPTPRAAGAAERHEAPGGGRGAQPAGPRDPRRPGRLALLADPPGRVPAAAGPLSGSHGRRPARARRAEERGRGGHRRAAPLAAHDA